MALPAQFAYRTSKSIGLVTAAPLYEHLPGFRRPEGNSRCCVYSPCGRYFAWASQECVVVVGASSGQPVASINVPNVYELGFSPLGTFIITWQRPSKQDNGDASKNLKVRRVVAEAGSDSQGDECNVIGLFVQKSQTRWNLQYTSDERYCARLVTNEIQFYQRDDLGHVWAKLRVEGVADFALSPGGSPAIAVFIPERNGQPAAVKVFNIPRFDFVVSQKNFYKGDKVQLKWNVEGTSLIVLAHTEVDKSGKNYYGETTLYLLSANGGFDSRINLDKEGPIHDVTWSPTSKEFGVVYGYMPAKTTIFNTRALATHSFALGPRNTILFSPNGRFVLVAGFGNLAGQVDIYDLEKDHQKVCTIEASNASVCEWSYDSKYVLTATTSPRLRVDNGVRIWHSGGGLMYNQECLELYQVTWRPQSLAAYTNENSLHPVPSPHVSALTYLDTVKTPSKPAGAYRPPGARGQLTPLAFKREDEGGAAYVSDGSLSTGLGTNGFGKPRKRGVPGAETISGGGGGVFLPASTDGDENLSKSAAKNKKKREAKKAKDVAGRASPEGNSAALAAAPSSTGVSQRKEKKFHESNLSKDNIYAQPGSRQEHADQSLSTSGNTRPSVTMNVNKTSIELPDRTNQSSDSGGSPQDKKVRALLKKLRAIDDLKMRLAGGEKLEGTQIKKMDTEDGVRRELESLGWTD